MRVGVIGAGISGLLCAQRLLASAPMDLHVSIFEWGRGPGGRTARRRVTLPEGEEVSFDHAAPFFTAVSPAFQALLSEWQSAGHTVEWTDAGKSIWVAQPSNHAICRMLAGEIASARGGEMLYGRHVRAARYASDEWIVSATNRADGSEEEHRFDALVFSDKLLLLPNPYAVLPATEWGPLALPPTLVSTGTIVLMLALEHANDAPHIAPVLTSTLAPLKLLVHDSAKPGRQSMTAGGRRPLDLWVAHSTAEYAVAHLVGDDPPGIDDEPARIREMQAATLATLAAAAESTWAEPRVAHAAVFMWDHAQPTPGSRLPTTHILDAARRAGVCGDFFAGSDGREGVEAAALSGRALANALMPLLSTATRTRTEACE